LGRGLDALLPTRGLSGGNEAKGEAIGEARGELNLPLASLSPNPDQPRRNFDDAALGELADSIKKHGVIQPVIVERAGTTDKYIIIAGERRCRAAKLAGLTQIPAVIREYSDEKRLEVALIENIQRQDLNPIEEAMAYKRLVAMLGASQEEAAARVGKSRSALTNTMRLLKLPDNIKNAVADGTLSEGHARAILSLENEDDEQKLFAEIVRNGLSVRAAEKRAAEMGAKPVKPAAKEREKKSKRDPDLVALEQKFVDALGTKVVIEGSFERGRVVIDFYSMEDLDALLKRVSNTNE
jgi:ParB family chromosome partitioning protein